MDLSAIAGWLQPLGVWTGADEKVAAFWVELTGQDGAQERLVLYEMDLTQFDPGLCIAMVMACYMRGVAEFGLKPLSIREAHLIGLQNGLLNIKSNVQEIPVKPLEMRELVAEQETKDKVEPVAKAQGVGEVNQQTLMLEMMKTIQAMQEQMSSGDRGRGAVDEPDTGSLVGTHDGKYTAPAVGAVRMSEDPTGLEEPAPGTTVHVPGASPRRYGRLNW